VSAELLVDRPDVRVWHAAWDELLAALPRRDDGTVCDLLCVDAPYSERTHAGHDDGVDQANGDVYNGQPSKRTPDRHRRDLAYPHWTSANVDRFVAAWAPLVRGWIVSLTDHMLAPAWEWALSESDRYVFAPLACMRPGSRIRLVGDGPAQWSEWAIVARPRTREMQRWGALPGGYVVPPGYGQAARLNTVVGGKPLWLMERLVEDYSRPGDLVCDPCMGAATTGVAALRVGRSFVGGDVLREHAELGARRLSQMIQRPLFVAGGE
jgi:hypothetical protein